MTLDMGNADKIGNFRRELERLQIPLLPPDINKSMAEFAVEQTPDGKLGVRYALAAIKGVGREAMNRLPRNARPMVRSRTCSTSANGSISVSSTSACWKA